MRDVRPAAPEVLIVVTTVGTQEQALDIANHLVESRLAACVNVVPGIRSIFRWKGEVNDDTEFMLLAKTVKGKYADVAAAIRELHSYELPEILAYPATFAEEAFAAWVEAATKDPDEPKTKVRK
jgi:periplasmic divalent cation tolerance protein